MTKGGYRGGSTVIGFGSGGFREAQKPSRKIKVPGAVRAQLAAQNKRAKKAAAARRALIKSSMKLARQKAKTGR